MLRLLCVAAVIAALSLSASAADAAPAGLERRVMAEISFDLALNQEGEGGYSASHAVSQYLSDEGLLWLRYFHSLASGTPGNAPMRVAMMEFKNRTAWGAFEQRHLGASQVLYDLFWINWRRLLWRTTDESSEFAPLSKERDTEAIAGFVWSFRYTPKVGREQAVKDLIRSHAKDIKTAAEDHKDFLEKRTFAAGSFQSQYKFLELYEFSSMEGLTDFTDDSSAYGKLLEALLPELSDFATTIYVPGQQNGRILAGQGAVLLSEAAKAAKEAKPDAIADAVVGSSSVSQENEKDEP